MTQNFFEMMERMNTNNCHTIFWMWGSMKKSSCASILASFKKKKSNERKNMSWARGWARWPRSSSVLFKNTSVKRRLTARRFRSAGWTVLWSSWETEQRCRCGCGPLSQRASYSPAPRSVLGTDSATSCAARSGPLRAGGVGVKKKRTHTFSRNMFGNVCLLTSLLRKQYRTATINPWKTCLNPRSNMPSGFKQRHSHGRKVLELPERIPGRDQRRFLRSSSLCPKAPSCKQTPHSWFQREGWGGGWI